jgi:membrane protease YdiL (CAAX protease family)
MSQETVTIGEASPACAPVASNGNGRRLRWFELSLVLLISFGSFFLSSTRIFINGPSLSPGDQNLRWIAGFIHEMTCLLLLGYVLSRRRARFRDLGLHCSFRDLGSGLLVAVTSYAAYTVGYFLVHSLHRVLFSSLSGGPTPHEIFGRLSIVALPYVLLNPIFEEVVVRAFVMTEVSELTGSWTLAAILSVLLQSSYHLYYGWQGALALSFQFLVFSIYFARTRRATPVIVAHAIFDLYGFVRLM